MTSFPSHSRAAALIPPVVLIPFFPCTLTAGHRPQAGSGFAVHPHPASGPTALFTFGLITLVIGMLLAFVLYLRRRARHPLDPAAHAEEFLSEGQARAARPPSPTAGQSERRTDWEKPDDWWKTGD